MLETIKTYKTNNFTVICQEEWCRFDDQYNQRGTCHGSFMSKGLLARVYCGDEEVGRAAVEGSLPDDRFEVLRLAINEARKTVRERRVNVAWISQSGVCIGAANHR